MFCGLIENLMTPHNARVVPLFAIQNHLLARLAGSLEAVPMVWGIACYIELLLAVIAVGLLVAVETNRIALGLAAMAGVGTSTVNGPVILWYSAGQSLCSGTLIVAMLLALSLWRLRGGWIFFMLAVLSAVAAPLYWSAGYVAGPVALAYLLAHRQGRRRVALLPVVASLVTGILVWSIAGRTVWSGPAGNSVAETISRIPIGLAHTTQAIPEILFLNNVGLNAETTFPQAVALCMLLALLWTASRTPDAFTISRGRVSWLRLPRPNSLEAAGATLSVTCFVMIYSARGYQSFDNLRALGWYHAIPQFGAVLFAAGWVAGRPQQIPPGPLIQRRFTKYSGSFCSSEAF